MTKATVLVAEDRENWRQTFCTLLEDMGYMVLEARCGKEFEASAIEAHVIVLDISMPMELGGIERKTAGLEVLVELQKKYPNHNAIQNPIVRSMWERSEFKRTPLEAVRVDDASWVSRNEPIADLLERIKNRIPKVDSIGA